MAVVGGDRHKLADRCQPGNERFPVLESMESEEIVPLTCCALTSKYFCNCSRLRWPLIS